MALAAPTSRTPTRSAFGWMYFVLGLVWIAVVVSRPRHDRTWLVGLEIAAALVFVAIGVVLLVRAKVRRGIN